jgi:hypothetical protein
VISLASLVGLGTFRFIVDESTRKHVPLTPRCYALLVTTRTVPSCNYTQIRQDLLRGGNTLATTEGTNNGWPVPILRLIRSTQPALNYEVLTLSIVNSLATFSNMSTVKYHGFNSHKGGEHKARGPNNGVISVSHVYKSDDV